MPPSELVEVGVAVPADAYVRGTVVEPVEGVVHGGVDAGRRPGPPHTDDRHPVHAEPPEACAVQGNRRKTFRRIHSRTGAPPGT